MSRKWSELEVRTALAITQLWDWVGEQSESQVIHDFDIHPQYALGYTNGKKNAYGNVRLYMRKFFAGLIDFEQE